MWRLRTLSSQMLMGVVGILFATVVVGGLLEAHMTRSSLDRQYEERARSVAAVVAEDPSVRSAVAAGDPDHLIQPLATRLAQRSGAAYVVVTDAAGVRFSHPNPKLIGKRLEEPVAVLDGRDHVGIDNGSLGRSANGKSPVFDASGRVIGEVSVGVLETQVAVQVGHEIRSIVAYSAIALALGVAVALLLARAMKRVTFGLEPREITALLQEREAMLHGITEGVIGFDGRGRVTLMNNEARRLLHIHAAATGSPLADAVGPGRLRDVLDGTVPGQDVTVLTDDALLVVNRRPVTVGGRDVGSIVTLRDRTELEVLVRRMNAVTGLTTALRAQEHEYTNRLHVIAGLLDLGETAEARSYLDLISQDCMVPAEDLRSRFTPAAVAALLVAKQAVASERGVHLEVDPDSHLDTPPHLVNTVMSIIGNLVDNAVDAASAAADDALPPAAVSSVRGTVHLDVSDDDGVLRLSVADSGSGVAAGLAMAVFEDGFSTKPDRGELRRGMGLALVKRLVTRAGGSVRAVPGDTGLFVLEIPLGPDGTDDVARVDLVGGGAAR